MHARLGWFVPVLILMSCAAPSLGGASSLSAAAPGATLFKDDFSSSTSGWERFKSAEGVMDYDGGGYRIMINALQTDFHAAARPDLGNVRLEVDAGKIGGPDENRMGLICRDTGGDFYFFIISSDGYYAVGMFAKGKSQLLGQTAMQPSDRIKTGVAANHLRADCIGQQLTWYVNGFKLAQVQNAALQHGQAGVLAGTFAQPGVDVIFDNFVVLQP